MNTLTIPRPFDFHEQINEVILVGVGGTGSQVARTLCRIVYDLRRRGQHVPRLKFVDPDLIEMTNVGRQMFTVAQVGQSKALTLATRFNLAMGLNIVAYPELFDAEKHGGHYSLVIGCVDNHNARQEISRVHSLWLDCGNGRTGGQVCIGNTADTRLMQGCFKNNEFRYLPNAALLFPQLLEPELAANPVPVVAPTDSCAERLELGDQDLLVNDLMGIVAGEYLYKLLNHRPILSFVTYADAETLSMRSIPITIENLKQYLESQ